MTTLLLASGFVQIARVRPLGAHRQRLIHAVHVLERVLRIVHLVQEPGKSHVLLVRVEVTLLDVFIVVPIIIHHLIGSVNMEIINKQITMNNGFNLHDMNNDKALKQR